jgi:hypothetical protein
MGLPKSSPLFLCTYGTTLVNLKQQHLGFDFGEQGANLVQKRVIVAKARVCCVYAPYLLPWRKPAAMTMPLLVEGREYGISTGEFQIAIVQCITPLLDGLMESH